MSFLNQIKDKIFSDADLDSPHLATFLNPYSYLIFRDHSEILEQMDRIYIDGEWLCKFLRIFGVRAVTRTSFDMTSLAPVIFNDAVNKSKSVYLIGSRLSEIEQAVNVLKTRWPDLNIVGYRSGYFDDKQKVFDEIILLNPDILVSGMGAINQENFILELREFGWLGQGYTCGGFFHQTIEKLHYYPAVINTLNLRWLFRIYKEPKLASRYFRYYPLFVLVFIYDFFVS